MVKYVSKDIICAKMMHCNFRSPDMTVSDFINDELPSADVQSAKHGKWIYVGSVRSWDEIKCSACNSAFSTEDRDLILNWDFCPHCGARMDGDK